MQKIRIFKNDMIKLKLNIDFYKNLYTIFIFTILTNINHFLLAKKQK